MKPRILPAGRHVALARWRDKPTNRVVSFLHRLRDGPEMTPHQAWRVRMLCERLAAKGEATDDREVYRHLEDALRLGLRKGLIFAQDAQEIVGLTDRGYQFLQRDRG